MLKIYFKIAYRNLFKNKFFTILNVIALALGMSLCLLYIAFLSFLFTYDDFHPKKDQIYRVTTELFDNEENPHYASAPDALASNLREDFAGVDKVVRINRSFQGQVNYLNKKIWLGGYFADPAFFEIFNFPFIRGNKETALLNPNSIVLSESEAAKIFGSKDALGKMVKIEPHGDFLVTGIFKDIPENSHFQFESVASYESLASPTGSSFLRSEEGWKRFTNSFLYVLLDEGSDPDKIDRLLNDVAHQKYVEEDVRASFELQPLNDIIMGADLKNPIGPAWNLLFLVIIGLTALIVLIPACSNYINLSISQSLERMREIGVRKVLGGRKKQIFLQFIAESVTIMLLALLFSYLIFEAIRIEFLNWVEIWPVDLSPTLVAFIGFILFALLVGFVAGIIPGLYFSKISPLDALKGKEVKSGSRFMFRKIVLTGQFVLSLGFIMAVVIMVRQYEYNMDYDLGFEQKNLLDVELQGVDPQIFKNEYEKISEVERISMSSHLLGIGSVPEHYIRTSPGADSIEAASISIDEAFISNLKLELVAGKNFSSNPSENAGRIIVNEQFIEKLDLQNPVTAINEFVLLPGGRQVRIAGVLKNFHNSGLKEPIEPFFFEYNPSQYNYANLKLTTNELIGPLSKMETLWKKIGGQGEFTAKLFSEEIKDAYKHYLMIIKLWGFLGLLAITVACLGLLGMITFSIKKRYKEISIRKVLGASSERLVFVLSKDFVILMVIASLIAIPVVYLLFDSMLATLQHYRIQIGFVEIIISLLIMMSLGLITILSQTLKAANANPAENLRSE